jgi:hypothetical protein
MDLDLDMDLMAKRLERLERQCRRWRWTGIVFALLTGTPILLLFLFFLMSDRTHEADRLLVRDKDGNARMDLGTNSDGTPRLLFQGRDGKVRLALHLVEDDSPTIWLGDKGGKNRLSMTVNEDGPAMDLKYQAGAARVRMTVNRDDAPRLAVSDKDGKYHLWMMHTDPDGTSRFDLLDKNQKFRMTIGLEKDVVPALGFMDQDGKVR